MSKLVAVKRLNVNGHLVTKWVNPESEGKSASSIPAPATGTVQLPIEAQRAEVSSLLRRALPNDHKYLRQQVDELQEKTIAYLYESLVDDTDDLAWEIAYMVNEGFQEETLISYVALRDVHQGVMDDMEGALWVEGLHTTGNNRQPLDPYDPDSVMRNGVLLKFCMEETNEGAIEAGPHHPRSSYDSNSNHHASQGVANFVYDNPDRVDEIREFVDKHWDLIKGRDSSGVGMMMDEADNITILSEGML